MKDMTKSTKFKLIAPVSYALITLTILAFTLVSIISSNAVQPHHYAGYVIIAISSVLWIVARLQLGNSFSIDAKASSLVTHGVYKKLRHPIYYFSIMFLIGIAVFLWNTYWLVPIGLIILLQAMRIKREETVLAKKFGDKYLRYKQQTWF